MLRKKMYLATVAAALLIGQNLFTDIGSARAAGPDEAAYEQLSEVPEGYIGIYTVEDLDKVRNNLNNKYILMKNIDLSTATDEGGTYFNSGAGWEPIGSEAAPFTGIFDGNGHSIKGMKMNLVSTDQVVYAGLFGYVKNATVQNVELVESIIEADNQSAVPDSSDAYAGGVIGYADNVVLTNVSNSGNVTAFSLLKSYAGGIIGFVDTDYNKTSTITDVHNSGEINAKTTTGGIAGKITRTNVTGATNQGSMNASLKGNKNAGGIVGDASQSTITDSLNEGSIHFTNDGGGIAAYIHYTSINTSVNKGKVISQNDSSDGGGITGKSWSNSTISSSYNTGDVKAATTAGGISGDLSYNSIISKSYNAGDLSAHYAGGIAGWLSNASIKDSFNIGRAYGGYDSGGIVGYGSDSVIQHTYNLGNVKRNGLGYTDIGGIAGEFTGTIIDSYHLDTEYKGVENGSDEGTYRKTLEELKHMSTYQNFDFNSTWVMDEGTSFHFPRLAELPISGKESTVDIEVKTNPDNPTQIEGEELDLTGGTLAVWTNYGNEKEVAMTNDMAQYYDNDRIGDQWVTLHYDDAFTNVKVTVVERDRTPPPNPIVDEVTENTTTITGSAEAGSHIEIKVGDEVIGSGTADEEGSFSIDIPQQAAHTELVITAADEWGNVSEASTVTVIDVTAPSKPIVDEVTDASTTVTGEAESESFISVMANGNEIGTTQSRADRTFSVEIPSQPASTELTVTAVDSTGNMSESVIVVVKDVTPPSKPTVHQVYSDSTVVTGTGEPGAAIEVKRDGDVVGSGQVDKNGDYSVVIPLQEAGTKLTVLAKDNAGNVSTATAIQVDGWKVTDGNHYYLQQGEILTGWQQLENHRYYFNEKGIYQTGWLKLDDHWYFFGEQGMTTGWAKSGGKWYFLNKEGIMKTGWIKDSGKWYYLEKSGAMKTGWLYSQGKWYYLEKSGSMKVGWGKVDGKWYYFQSSGIMKTGWLQIIEWYYLGKDGAMVTGWQEIGGKWYYFYPSGDNQGLMAFNTMVGSYYVGPDGAWVKNY
jgi:glucan-binding YG repeat protein